MIQLNKIDTGKFLKSFHAWATIAWAVLIPVSLFTKLRESVAWIVFMSVYANFVSHFGAWQSSRAEVKGDERKDA